MAADVSARVHLVAEKLQLKAQDAQRKGNEIASRALSASVSDLREALALLSEQRHLLARRRGEGDDEDDNDANTHVQAIATRLLRVETMLEKKAGEMKTKGNENAAAALQQSAGAVATGRTLLLEQQQTIFGLLGRWEKLQSTVNGHKKHTRNSAVCNTGKDNERQEQEKTEQSQLIARVQGLVQLEDEVAGIIPDCNDVKEVRNEVEKLKKELKCARNEANEANEMLKQERLALDKVKSELVKTQEREVVRQEEDAELLEQQRDACQAMEQLVRESDQEIRVITQSAAKQAEELQSLKIEIESLAAEKERVMRTHKDEVDELQGQLTSAMDALSLKIDAEKKLKAVQIHLDSVTLEKKNLVKAHAEETEELRRQLENAATSLSAASAKAARANTDELQTLLASVNALTAEKESLTNLHTNEVEELQKAHLDELDDLRQKCDCAMSNVSTKTEAKGELDAGIVQITTKILTFDEEDLAQSYADKVEALQKAHEDEIDDLHRQLKRARSSLSAHMKKIDASNTEKLQLISDKEANVTLQKEDLAEIHGNELKTLREAYVAEAEDLRHQLETSAAEDTVSTKERTELVADKLQQQRVEMGALIIERDRSVDKHAVVIDELYHQVKRAEAGATNKSKGQKKSSGDANNGDGEYAKSGDILVMELEENVLQPAEIADEDEVGTDGDKLHSQRMTISELGQKQFELNTKIKRVKNEKIERNEIQRAHETGMGWDQAGRNICQARVSMCEDGCQAQESAGLSRRKEQAEHQEHIEFVADEPATVIDKLRSSCEEEKTCLSQRLADSEDMVISLGTQLEEMQRKLATKSAGQEEAAKALMHCKAELCACRSELDGQVLECSRLQSELEAVQEAEDAKGGAIDEHLSKLTSELREVETFLRSSSMVDGNAMHDFTSKVWQSLEVAELCSRLAPLLTDLMLAQDQARIVEEHLELMRGECDSQKAIIDQYVKTIDWRLFAKDGETVNEVTEALNKDLRERLSVAKTNTCHWLDELELLRDRVEKNLEELHALEHENLQDKERLVALEQSEHDLKVLTKSMKEKLVTVQSENREAVQSTERLKAQNQSASIQKQQLQVAQQEEVAVLEQQLATIRSDFDRYRVRSHTALKKMEKRAELLNGMRKENERLLEQVREVDRQREQAVAAGEEISSRLQEMQHAHEMMQVELNQVATEKSRILAKLEDERHQLASEKEQLEAKVQKLAAKIQELETEKKHSEAEVERIKNAEQAAFQTYLDSATAAAQSAKLELQKTHDALEVSKTENDKRQRYIESLEIKLKKQSHRTVAVDTTSNLPVEAKAVISAPVVYVSPLITSPTAEEKMDVARLMEEMSVLRASDVSLRKQLNAAQAELVALQERFATTKAANAEKVFALEEQSNRWKAELAVVTEELQRLNTVVEAQKKLVPHSLTSGTTISPIDQTKDVQTSATRTQELLEQIRVLQAELADANTEIALLTRALDGCREELQQTQTQLDQLASSSSDTESCEDSSAVLKARKVLAAKEEALKKMRVQSIEMQEEMQTLRKEKTALQLKLAKQELNELQVCRDSIQSEKARAMRLQRRKAVVSCFEKQVEMIVDELQKRLEEHSSAFREVCDFRDEHRAFLFSSKGEEYDNASDAKRRASNPEFEEYLVMRSGVVIKAGARFELPVICERSGCRVVWSFSIKEDAADVSFKLSAMTKDATSSETEVVSPERMNDMSGVFPVQQENTTLVFEWDNSFSWLNEKTLDYHVSVQEPLTLQAQKVRRCERELQTKAKLLNDGMALIQFEAKCRSELSDTLKRLGDCEAAKGKYIAEFTAQRTELMTQKTRFQKELDAQKALLSAMLREQDELEDVERSIIQVWESAVTERQDADMTLQLTGNGAQLETLAHTIEEEARVVADELKTNSFDAGNTAEMSMSEINNNIHS